MIVSVSSGDRRHTFAAWHAPEMTDRIVHPTNGAINGRECPRNLAAFGVEHHKHFSAGRKESMVLGIERNAGGLFARRNGPGGNHLVLRRINDRHLAFIFNIAINLTSGGVGYGKLRASIE